MKLSEYVETLKSTEINATVAKINSLYGNKLPEMIKKIISNAEETVFLDNEYRILSAKEILDAEADLHVTFVKMGIIPLVDCGENDFIVYHVYAGIWSRFNIIDETVFMRRESLSDF